jgi:hypothetical protein
MSRNAMCSYNHSFWRGGFGGVKPRPNELIAKNDPSIILFASLNASSHQNLYTVYSSNSPVPHPISPPPKMTPPHETPLPLPSAPLIPLAPHITLQPPLSRRGHGPGLIVITPSITCLPNTLTSAAPPPSLDILPQQKWAEEGYAVVDINSAVEGFLDAAIRIAIGGLKELESCDCDGEGGVFVVG